MKNSLQLLLKLFFLFLASITIPLQNNTMEISEEPMEDIPEVMEFEETEVYYKDTPKYRRIVAIINSRIPDKNKINRLQEAYGSISGVKIPETWLLHEAIEHEDIDTVKGLVGMFGDDIVAKDTLRLALRSQNPSTIYYIKKYGGKV